MSEGIEKPPSFDESLLKLVRSNPQLYREDPRANPYETRKKQIELWKTIGLSLGAEPKFCMLRWNLLVERYVRQKHAKLYDARLMERMGFLEPSRNFARRPPHMPNNAASNSNSSNLPEPMETQPSTNGDTTNAVPPTVTASTNSALVRIKVLLGGLDATNRNKAEKRVLSYLCKCQLKTLENESIDDIIF